jgi:DUF2075 family protein
MTDRAFYRSSIQTFLAANENEVLGALVGKFHFDVDINQKNAWIRQISDLKRALSNMEGGEIFLEFTIPRMGKRVDAVLLANGLIFVLEYKIGASTYDTYAKDQVLDYALDLKNFHEGSHDKFLIPILISTRAAPLEETLELFEDRVAHVLVSNGHDLDKKIAHTISRIPKQIPISADSWLAAGYKPTPTIIEAAQALYQHHSVADISRSDSGAKNLTLTSSHISEIINHSETNRRKSICFVTGVPGAGKTLAGLNISTQQLRAEDEKFAVFLSGNGPLVNVLREALTRDEVGRAKMQGSRLAKKKTYSKVSAFIQNIHHFRDDSLKSSNAPPEHVVVFDEAQRAWNQQNAERFMTQKRGQSGFSMSEPEFLISVMDRRKDWATIVCLIGGGQEINTGEAGLVEWFESIYKRFSHWDVYYPPDIEHKDYSWGQDLKAKLVNLKSKVVPELHLSVSIRSFRAEKLSEFVGCVIEGDLKGAQMLLPDVAQNYALVITRELAKAREWLKSKGRGNQERYGLVASSGGLRLKPEGINVKAEIDPVNWFLNEKKDVRSSFSLEDVATEFDIQGLELDWVGACWDADFRRCKQKWSLHSFKGTKWQDVKDIYKKAYLTNAYRVILTRARQGMVVYVPKGDSSDETRPPNFYDETYDFLVACGFTVISS